MIKQVIINIDPMIQRIQACLLVFLLAGIPTIGLAFQNQTTPDSCNNVTDPGEIGYDQILCAPGNDPAPLVSVRQPSGGEGELEYLWMYSEEDGAFTPSTYKPIPNSNSETYDPGPLFKTTYFARCVRRVGCAGFIEPEVVKITVRDEARANIIGPSLICDSDTVTYRVETKTANPSDITWGIPPGVNVLEDNGKTCCYLL